MDAEETLAKLRTLGDPASVKGRARFGIPEENAWGVPLPKIRRLAKELGHDRTLANALWKSGIHEARLLATIVMPPEGCTRAQVERWLKDVRSWDICDALALNLVDRTDWAWTAASAWARSDDEWTKRLGFATMAGLATHAKDAADSELVPFLAVIEKSADDDRNYVKKAASWALRQIGKRSALLRRRAMATAHRLMAKESKGARWVGADAARELGRGQA